MAFPHETDTTYRRDALPARAALAALRHRADLQRRLAALGFVWQPAGCDGPRAHWTEAGFDLTAGFAPDPGGWFAHGVTALGHFTDRRAPQAVPPHRGGRHSFRGCVPVDPAVRHAAYRRACAYGEIGCYRLLVVRVAQAGVVLAEDSLGAIESDTDEDLLAEWALELADDAMARAETALRRLCGGVGCADGRG